MSIENRKAHSVIKLVSLSLFVFQSMSVYAGQNHGDLDGLYIPKKGWAESQELRPGEDPAEQLGRFKVQLNRKGWNSLSNPEKERIRKKLVISGVFRGLVEDPQGSPIVEHLLSNRNRDGALYTMNDAVFVLGAEPCAPIPGAVALNIKEILNIERGTGEYQGLQSGGSIALEGTINLCTSQNDFEVIPNEGGMCFGTDSNCE